MLVESYTKYHAILLHIIPNKFTLLSLLPSISGMMFILGCIFNFADSGNVVPSNFCSLDIKAKPKCHQSSDRTTVLIFACCMYVTKFFGNIQIVSVVVGQHINIHNEKWPNLLRCPKKNRQDLAIICVSIKRFYIIILINISVVCVCILMCNHWARQGQNGLQIREKRSTKCRQMHTLFSLRIITRSILHPIGLLNEQFSEMCRNALIQLNFQAECLLRKQFDSREQNCF